MVARVFWIFFVLYRTAFAEVNSCYACAGPQTDCISDRTDFLKMDCQTFKVENQSLIHRTSEPDLLEIFDNEVGSHMNDEIGCLTLTFTRESESPSERAVKSCVPVQVSGEDICTYMEGLVEHIGGKQSGCKICKSDDCNSGVLFLENGIVLSVVGFIYFCKHFL